MTLELDTAAGARTEAARILIARAQDEPVELATVSALQLCVLGGPAHPLFDEVIARAWGRLGHRQRKRAIASVTDDMLSRGQLISTTPQTRFPGPDGMYALQPELGLMLAARCHPSLVVVTSTEDDALRTPRCFGLGDRDEPVRGAVLELPTALPADLAPDYPHVAKLGPLGWFYRYVLLSRTAAAQVLAEYTISPPRRSGEPLSHGYLVSAYYPGQRHPQGRRLLIRGDGSRARLSRPDDQPGDVCDLDGLRAVIADWLTGPPP